ncbi:aldo/keto reductase [Lacticaseibacillus suibinensis]|uniref:aldo/keto reductase n=1 Tax=Lacticaseibacillus suibinensis TaxID=2486011 RepID=UPI000F76CB47|nr:aldo/keto reductase [Lacticaseibacillus suibinensis]
MKTIQLNNGIKMPQLGYGVFQIDDPAQCEQSVLDALQTGYRLIDTAACYGNEAAVGKAIAKSGIPRTEIFISSKVWIQTNGYEQTLASFQKTLANLQTDYLDLYLIHMPYGDYYGSWRAMQELYRAGKIRALGVCNFLPDRLVDLMASFDTVPAVNQIELHPFSQRRALRTLMAKYRITPMAWAPFAEGQHQLFTDPTMTAIGAQYSKTAAQVTLRWLEQSGVVAIPKSVHLARIRQNFTIDDFALNASDMEKINQLDTGQPLILDVASCREAYRLHHITFVQ